MTSAFKSGLVTIILVLAVQVAHGQSTDLLTLDQLNKRIEHGADTVYVINLWATWCGPCVEEIPNFEKFSSEHSSEKLKVILLSVDFKSKASTVDTFVSRKKIKNEVYILDEKSQQEYIARVDKKWTGVIPATLFVNKSKNKREFYEQVFALDDLVNKYNQIK